MSVSRLGRGRGGRGTPVKLARCGSVLHHVTLEISSDDAGRVSRLFELCGFTRVEPPKALGDGYVWLERAGTQVHLELREEPVVPERGHAAIVVDDLEAALARLREAGFELRPGRELWGAARAFAALPGGGRIELMAAPPSPSGAAAGPEDRRREHR